jgi:transcriptional regulator with XRE-family HTH domain
MSSENTQKKPGEKLGKIVRNARKTKSMTQAECASLCGLGRRHFQKIEAGEVNPPLAFFSKLSGVLDTRACYFLNEESLDSPLSEHGIACESEILNLIPLPVFIASVKGELLYRNASFIKVFGSTCSNLNEIFSDELDQKLIREQILSSTSKEIPQLAQSFRLMGSQQTPLVAQFSWNRITPSLSQASPKSSSKHFGQASSQAQSAVLGIAILLPSRFSNGT